MVVTQINNTQNYKPLIITEVYSTDAKAKNTVL